jgi:hypothetical protein
VKVDHQPYLGWRRAGSLAAGFGIWLIAGSLTAQALELGKPFRVNDGPAVMNWLEGLDVTAIAEDAFIVSWVNTLDKPVATRVDSTGVLAPEFPLGFRATDLAGAEGTFWVTGLRYDTGASRVVVQRFDAEGAPASSEIAVSEEGDPYPSARLAAAADGTFMVAWFTYFDEPFTAPGERAPEACGATGSHGRGFQSDGLPAGAPFSVPSSDGATRVVPGGPGVWVVSGTGNCDEEGEATGERRWLDGSPVGPAFSLDDAEELTALSGGDLAGVWPTYYEMPREIRVRRYAPDGLPRGAAMPIRSCEDCLLYSPRIAGGSADDFLVVWLERPLGGSEYSLYSRWVSAAGTLSEIAAVSTTEPYYSDLEVASDRSGRFLVLWPSEDGTGDYDIWGRIVHAPTIFSDGFESGDTAAWSQTVP